MIAKREKAITKMAPTAKGIETKKEGPDPSNANEALLILGIACRDPRWADEPEGKREPLRLEPWAVQAALSRRTASKLTDQEIADVRRCTREVDTLRCPKSGKR